MKHGEGVLISAEGHKLIGRWDNIEVEGLVKWNWVPVSPFKYLHTSRQHDVSYGTFHIHKDGEIVQQGYSRTKLLDGSLFTG